MELFLDQHHTPYITFDGELPYIDNVTCVIDSGFTGGIALPKEFQDRYKLEPTGYQTYCLADGTTKELAEYEIKVKIYYVEKTIPLVFTDNSIGLVEIKFLDNQLFILDLKEMGIYLN